MAAELENNVQVQGPALVKPDGTCIALSDEQYWGCLQFLWQLDDERSAGEFDSRLSTGEAAAILGVSRRTLTRMLDRGEIPCERMGKNHHRTLKLADVLEFKAGVADYMRDIYESVARSERDIAAGRVRPAQETIDEIREVLLERERMAV